MRTIFYWKPNLQRFIIFQIVHTHVTKSSIFNTISLNNDVLFLFSRSTHRLPQSKCVAYFDVAYPILMSNSTSLIWFQNVTERCKILTLEHTARAHSADHRLCRQNLAMTITRWIYATVFLSSGNATINSYIYLSSSRSSSSCKRRDSPR